MLRLAGRLGRASAVGLSTTLREALGRPNQGVVIDFQGVDYLSSPGLTAIREALALARARDFRVVVTGLTEPVRMTL